MSKDNGSFWSVEVSTQHKHRKFNRKLKGKLWNLGIKPTKARFFGLKINRRTLTSHCGTGGKFFWLVVLLMSLKGKTLQNPTYLLMASEEKNTGNNLTQQVVPQFYPSNHQHIHDLAVQRESPKVRLEIDCTVPKPSR
ncbi:hypothetical protein pdam_00008602, partial [Pocillopora damicornis]